MWTDGLPHQSGLPYLTGVSHLHVKRPLSSLLQDPQIFLKLFPAITSIYDINPEPLVFLGTTPLCSLEIDHS